MRLLMLAAALALSATLAHARPPEGADPALAPWFESLQHPTLGACCSVADCRPVEFRVGSEGYEVLIGRQFPGETEPHWEKVPPDAILQVNSNPVGQAVACWYGGRVRCFVRPVEA